MAVAGWPADGLYSLDDIPQVTGSVESQQSVVNGHLVERRSFLVAYERVWDPDASPAVVTEPQLSRPADAWDEHEACISPRLTQVHAHRVVLYSGQRHSRSGIGAAGPPVFMMLARYASDLLLLHCHSLRLE